MDWKIFSATFMTIFFAELADKTQLAGIGMSAKSGRPLTVLLGSVLAYVLVTAISVLIGATLGRYIKPEFIKYAGALIFMLIGLLIFSGRI